MPAVCFALRGPFTSCRAYVDQQTPAAIPLAFDRNGVAAADVDDGPHMFTWFVMGTSDAAYDVAITAPDAAKWTDRGVLADGQDQGIRLFHT